MLMGFSAMKMVPISTYAILMNLKAILVILISHFYLSDKMTLKRLILVIVSFLGAFMIVKPDLISNMVSCVVGTPSIPPHNSDPLPDIYSSIPIQFNFRTNLFSGLHSDEWQLAD
jgi:drug/metabolite transporter (DMT)-like permease